MTDITPFIPADKKVIESYGGGSFKVSGEKFSHNLIIIPLSVHKFETGSIESTSEQHLAPILENADDIEVLLVGCGAATKFFPKETEALLKSKGISAEYMDTGAAARTYNVLLSEERKVAVVLIAV